MAARRQHLVEAAQALIRERADAGFSMALLAERAGVSAATPYNLLRSKSEILRLVVREDIARFVRELKAQVGGTPLASLLIAVDRLVGHYEADRQFHIGLFRAAFGTDAPEVRGILSTESWAWWNRLVEAAADSGEIADIVRPRSLTDALLRMMGAVVQTWIAEGWPPDRFTLEMSLSVRLVLASACTPPLRDAMIRDIAALQAKIDALSHERSQVQSGTV
ncbi:TetR/AcrR family transcriptional regulator [Sphingomonas sp. SUN019]|uniref:TetR/AcrR family transcriptional regulator n=1 Tax=Sphingomonas sp. SUN019 TaxID=2937788 RepID=UPI0021640BF1|nr:TetR/AcrR family transcriptional regulator [Sphingomonas sp. SUN019]UVO50888.1 TetR/AcrR family transcriptional regulator [Sphingomonas sp. SUN019]